MTLEGRLERLATRTPPGDAAYVMSAARARAEEASRRPRRTHRLLAAAAAVTAVLAAGAVLLLRGGTSDDTVTVAGPDDATDVSLPSGAQVSVAAQDSGRLTISTSDLVPSADGWLEHTVTVTNTGVQPSTFNLLPVGEILGDREVAVAVEGCRYDDSSESALDVQCEEWEPVTIEPGGTHRFTVTLWRDLPGLSTLATDPLIYEVPVEEWTGPTDSFKSAPGSITFTYSNLAAHGELDIGPFPSHAAPTYDLDLAGASLVEDSPHTGSNSDVVLWSDGNGAYLSLTVRHGRSASWATPGAGATVRDETFPEGQGEAWFSEPDDPRAATMWWVRPSGDLWLSNGYWYGDSAPESPEVALRTWALGIVHRPSANPPYRAEGVGLTMVASEDAGDRPSRSRVWEYDGKEIVLLVNERSLAAGPSNLLARGAPVVTDVPGLGEVWRVGSTYGWAVAGEDAWATLTVPDALAERAPEILAGLRQTRG